MTTTTYLEWDDQATGANNNTWGDVTDANLTILEQAIARFASISTTGGTTTLTSSQNRYPVIRITGALVSNATIVVRTAEKNWNFINATTGAFSLTVKTTAGTGKTVPRGRAVKLYCDGTNVEQARFVSIPMAQAGGTVDVITATFEPATVSGELQDGTLFIVEAAGANTSTTPTFNPDSLGALTITKNGGQALVAGDIRAAGHKLLLCYDASSARYELLNPNISGVALTGASNTFTDNQFLTSNTDYKPQLQLTHSGATAGSGPYVIINRARGTIAAPTIVSSGDQIGSVLFQGYDGSANRGAASIEAQVDGTPGASDMPGRLTFKTTPDGSTTATERMRIDSSGNVLIGTTTGTNQRPLTVQTPAGNYAQKILASASEFGLIEFVNNANSNTNAIIGSVSTNVLAFFTNGFTERMRIDASGNVLVTGAGGLGYGTGSGGTVTQLTSKATGVTINKTNGQIISHNALLVASSEETFTVTNSTVSATDNIILTKVSSGGATSQKYQVFIGAVAAGSFDVVISNISGTNGSDAITMNFAVIKSVTA